MITTIHLVVARSSQWNQWTPVKGFTSEDDARAFVQSIVDANAIEQGFFDQMMFLILSNMQWTAIMEKYEEIRSRHPAPDFRDRGMEYQVQPLDVVGSA